MISNLSDSDPFGILGDEAPESKRKARRRKTKKQKLGEISEAESMYWNDYWDWERKKTKFWRIINNI